MKLFKHAVDSNLYQIHELDEDTLINWFAVFQSYKITLTNLIRLRNPDLLKVTQTRDIAVIRKTLTDQLKSCNDYIEFWKETINKAPQDQKKN